MAAWHIGIIGGSGLYEPGALDEMQEIPVASAFGEPSAAVTTGRIAGHRFTFLPRHGAGHTLSPSHVNYRANIDVLKRCGVTDVLAISAVGSLQENIAPGQFAGVAQVIDRTIRHERSFFGDGIVAHVPLGDPVCPRLGKLASAAFAAAGGEVHENVTYVAIEGPQFSTRAESRLYREWGGQVIGMTAMPEARLAREAELPYALMTMVTDYDCWREDTADVNVAQILATMRGNAEIARAALVRLAESLPEDRQASAIDTVLDTAIVTPASHWAAAAAARLDAVAARIIKNRPDQL